MVKTQRFMLLSLTVCLLGLHPGLQAFPIQGDFYYKLIDFPGKLPPGPVTAIFQTSNGYIWISLINRLVKFDGLEFELVSLPVKENKQILIISLSEAADGSLMVQTTKEQIRLPLPGNFPGRDTPTPGNIPAGSSKQGKPQTITFPFKPKLTGGDGSIWEGSRSGLVRIIKGPGGETAGEQVISHQEIMVLYEDRDNNIWIGTREHGLKCLKRVIFKNFLTKQKGHSNYIRCIFKDRKNNLWAGSNRGKLYRFNNNRLLEVPLEKDIFDNIMFVMSDDAAGNLLLGTEHKGLWLLKNGRLSQYTTKDGPVEGTITEIFHDSKNRLWISKLKKGLGYIQNNTFHWYITEKDYPGNKMVFNVVEDSQHNIWIGFSAGVHFISNSDDSLQQVNMYLKELPVSSINEDENGNMWFGTYGQGLVYFNKKEGNYFIFSEKEGLGTNSIYQLLEDQKGFFWIASPKGIVKVDKKELIAVSQGKQPALNSIVFGLNDGLGSILCSVEAEHSAVKTAGGEFLFATTNGLAMVQPGTMTGNSSPTPVIIKKIIANGRAVDIDTGHGASQGLSIEPVEFLEITFTAAAFPDAGKFVYRYRLSGIDSQWQILAQPKSGYAMVSYRDLPAGDYTFMVNARRLNTASGQWGRFNKRDRLISFNVAPHLWETPVFRSLAAFFLALVILTGILLLKRYHLKKANKYGKTKIDAQTAKYYVDKLLHLLEEEKVYRDPQLSVKSLAVKMGIPDYHISQIINDKLKKNFFDLINSYRVEEAKGLLLTPENPKILQVAYITGFNSLTSFNRVFKKHMNMTPSQFRKENTSEQGV
jgi:ligand-binding sensor domain-containing protein/AraC-like DNA-binding protein